MLEKPMREMTLDQYLRHSLMQHITKDAEKDGIRIVAAHSRPTLAASGGEVVRLEMKEPRE